MGALTLRNWLILEQKILGTEVNGKSLLELTTYEDIALWWFVRFRFFNRVYTTVIQKALTKNACLFLLCDFIYDLITNFISRFISTIYKKKRKDGRPTVLITVNDRDWKTFWTPSQGLIKGDMFFHTLISELQTKGYSIVTITPLKINLFSAIPVMISRLKHQQPNLTHTTFNHYWSLEILLKELIAKRHFKKIWKKVKNNERSMNTLKSFGLEQELSTYFHTIFGYVVKCLEISKKIIAKEKPKIIIVSSEHGIIQKSIMVAGKIAKIPTLALQHGTIGHIHKGYISWEGSISESGNFRSPFCPIPDKTAVFGPYYYHILTSISAYPKQSVVVTGLPKYDLLIDIDEFYDKKIFCRKLNLDPSKKIVLVVTENLPVSEGRHLLKIILRALREFKDLQVVLKPHPAERGMWYKKVVKEEAIEVKILSKDADTYEALYSCDFFIASYSTVILEGIMLGKIGVTVYLGKDDPTPYFKDVTLRVYKETEISSAIKKILYDKKIRDELMMKCNAFIKEHLYMHDGMATKRVSEIIDEMVRRSV